jgi:enterochelin esterase family protein
MNKKIKICLLLLFINIPLFSQSLFQQFINRVNSVNDVNLKTVIVDSFMVVARNKGIPFIEGNTANFIYRGSANTVSIAGDMTGWDVNTAKCTKLSGTNFFYYSANYELNARLDYKIVLNGSNWILDPENPNTCPGGFGPNSELAMPLFVQPWEIKPNNNAAQFSTVVKTFHSNTLNRNYTVTILLPPGYSTSNEFYPTVYFQDGSDYLNLCSAKNILTNLLDSNKIKKVIGVFVTPTNRNDEYAGTNRFLYADLFVNEIVPYIDANYRTIPNGYERLVLGDSFGGNISALISYKYPEVFANCGLHSAAFWPNDYEVFKMIAYGEKKDIKIYSIWGTYESLFTNLRVFTDSLNSKGYINKANELPQGHSWGLWRSTLDEILTFFFPADPVSVYNENNIINTFRLNQNYPNPFNPVTNISFELNDEQDIELSIFNSLGEKIVTLCNGIYKTGKHEITFNAENLSSGIYFYALVLKNQNKKMTKKMVYIK